MQISATERETQISTLITGLTTSVLNNIANLEEELRITTNALKETHEKLKQSQAEVEKLEGHIRDLEEEIKDVIEKTIN